MPRRRLAWTAAIVLGAAAACAVLYTRLPRVALHGQPPAATLSAATLPELQRSFNEASDSVRVILLLSPT